MNHNCKIWAIASSDDAGLAIANRGRADELSAALRGDVLRDFFYRNYAGHYEQAGSRVVMSIRGPLFTEDYERIQGNLAKLKSDDTVKVLILDVRSPGGEVAGCPETAQMVKDFGKPTAAMCCGMATSAAYWIASQADEVAAQSSCSVGSIGVIATHVSIEKMLKEQGIEVTEVSKGDKKGQFSPNHSLTDEGKKELTSQVNHFYSEFVNAVKAKRKDLGSECLQSGVFYGKKAKEAGLIDSVITNMSELVKG